MATSTLRASTSEAQFQRSVIDLAHTHHWRVFHALPSRTERGGHMTAVQADGAGFVDLVLVRERVIFCELKSQRGSLTERQRDWLAWLRTAGADVRLWRPSSWPEIAETLSAGVRRVA